MSAAADAPLDPPDADEVYADYLETCKKRINVAPVPRERAGDLIRGMVGVDRGDAPHEALTLDMRG